MFDTSSPRTTATNSIAVDVWSIPRRLNFHNYAWPEAVPLNGGSAGVVAFDETGFASPSDRVAAPETDAVTASVSGAATRSLGLAKPVSSKLTTRPRPELRVAASGHA